MRDPAKVVVRSEFRPNTFKVFTNSEDKAVDKKLSDKKMMVECARAAFFDVEGIETMDFDLECA